MSQHCQHCGAVLPTVVDAFCPECREDLSAPRELPIPIKLPEVIGAAGMSNQELADEISRGGRLVIYQYCVSIGVLTFLRPTKVYLIRWGESPRSKGWGYTFISLLVGWWGIPWGFIYTPWAVLTNITGGKDVTEAFIPHLPFVPPTNPQ